MPTMSRDAMEAHLTLHGWVPVSYGSAGARQGRLIIFVFRHKADDALLAQHCLLRDTQLSGAGVYMHDVDSWYWSDPLFMRLARAIAEHDRNELEIQDQVIRNEFLTGD